MNNQVLRKKLASLLDCEVMWQNEILNYYSVDSSSYKIKPKVVVFPKNSKDVIKTIKFAYKNKIPVTSKGAGTGLVGGAIGNGIIIDLKNLDSIKVTSKTVLVEAGVLKGELDKKLKKYKKFLGPNPSIGPYCSIGGMIGTNASGSRSLKYGSMVDNLLSIKFVSGKGDLIELPRNKIFSKKITKISRGLDKAKYPSVSKNSSGYRLDTIVESKDSHKVIAGSEGTLGVIVSAKLKLFSNPNKRILFIVGFISSKDAAKNCNDIIKLDPSAVEFVDKSIIKKIDYDFSNKDNCLLFIEFDSKLKEKSKKLEKIVHGRILLKTTNPKQIEKWWKYRDSALSVSLRTLSKSENAPHIIEDATVPVSNLPKLFKLISKIRKLASGRVVVYGHAGNGNLHVRLFSKNKNKKLIKKIAKFYFSGVLGLGGTITGEHGDGLARSEFVKKQYGVKNYSSFKKLKNQFDPKGILNPNKIITQKSIILRNLQI